MDLATIHSIYDFSLLRRTRQTRALAKMQKLCTCPVESSLSRDVPSMREPLLAASRDE